MKNKAIMERKFADIDKKAEKFKDSITKKP
jgi:hypothetical protein